VGSPGLRGLWALRASDGSPVWRGPARLAAGIRTAPAVAGGRVYAAGDSRLFVLQEATGRVLGSVPLGRWSLTAPLMEPCTTPSPLVLGSTVLVGAGDEADTLRAIPVAALAGG
jgi:outer membrane protein assembly factor BamB